MSTCYLADALPQGFETDFRAWVTYDNMAARAKTPEAQDALLDYAQRVLIHGPLTPANIDSFMDFYRCGEVEQEREKRNLEVFGSGGPRGFDFAIDGALIWAAFLQAYRIDLHTARLHWWDFMALFRNLPEDCRICRIIDYRTHDLNELPKESRAEFEKYRRVYALPADVGGEAHRYASWNDRKAAILARKQELERQKAGAVPVLREGIAGVGDSVRPCERPVAEVQEPGLPKGI
mgnify:FL=1